jgi:Icc-related predicted phosphoesterase
MRILLVSDIENEYIWDHFDPARFSNIDLVISCGDLKRDYLSFIATMIQAPVFFVHGNHDTDYLKEPPGGCDSIEDKLVVYRGLRIVGLGGCKQYNRHPKYSVPPLQYTEKQMEKRIRKLNGKIAKHKGFDILVTHAPAFGVGDSRDLCHTGFEAFLPLLEKYKPKYMLHGHMHLNYGRAPRIITHGETQVVDAYNYYILEIPSDNLSR